MRRLPILLFVVLCNAEFGCKEKSVPPSVALGADGRPLPPLQLAQPVKPVSQSETDPDLWRAYRILERTGRGQYNVACYHARLGQPEPALYWLQRSALEESADADYAAVDPDLVTLRTDPRWPGVFAFLKATQAWYRAHPLDRQLLSLPANHPLGRPLPLVIGLHGLGSVPEDFAGAWDGFADELGVAFLSVSGTETLGPQAYRWTEDVEADTARLERAIAAVAPRVKAIDGQVFLIGFSQGAQMAVEIVAHRPSRFGGAIAMSPGLRGSGVPLAAPAADASKPRYVIVANEKEQLGNIRLLRQNEARLKELGAQVYTYLYAGVATHSFSPDFKDALPRWFGFLARGEERE